MDCRRPAVLFVALLLGSSGCATSLPVVRVSKARIDADEEMTHKAPTYVAYGDFRARTAEAPETTPSGKHLLLDEAKLSYLKAIEIDPKYLPAYVSLARVQMAVEDHNGAAQIYGKALELSPSDASLWFELGMCNCRSKDWTAALSNMNKAREIDPNNRQFTTGMGLALARAGHWDEAYSLLARVNGQAKAHYDLARMLKHVNKTEDARKHAAAAVAADPRFDAAKTLLGELEKGTALPAAAAVPTAAVPAAPVRQVSHAAPAVEAAREPVAAVRPPEEQPEASGLPAPPPYPIKLAQTTEATPQPHLPPPPPTAATEAVTETPRVPGIEKPIRVPPLPVIRLGQQTELAGGKE